MNILMHDIIKTKYHDYRWIGALYKRGKKMIRFITNHGMVDYIFCNHSKLELLKIAKTRFAYLLSHLQAPVEGKRGIGYYGLE